MTAIAAMHVAKKQLGLDDDTYRAVLVRVTGKASAKDMTEAERNQVLAEFRRQGFAKSDTAAGRKLLQGRFATKLQALWIGAWNLGLVENRSDQALVAFVKRQTGIDHVRFVRDPADAAKAIEALKAWTARAAGVDWSVGNHLPDWMREPGAQIAIAQWHILYPGPAFHIAAFRAFVQKQAGKPSSCMEGQDWQPVMNVLGEMIRRAKR